MESATDRNISLNTKGQGYVNVNNENLLQVIELVNRIYLWYILIYKVYYPPCVSITTILIDIFETFFTYNLKKYKYYIF